MTSRVRREAGILLPLFSVRSDGDWGIGEIGAVPAFCRWLASAGHRLLQLLPIFEMSPGERSPYAALSAFAIDPVYVSVGPVPDFVAAGGEEALCGADRATLATVRAAEGIEYEAVRALKRHALQLAFRRFRAETQGGERAAGFAAFREASATW